MKKAPETLTVQEIVDSKIESHSTGHFYRAKAWIEQAKRTSNFTVLLYAAIELRYGIEYLLFEILALNEVLTTEAKYQAFLAKWRSDLTKGLDCGVEDQLKLEKRVQFIAVVFALSEEQMSDCFWNFKSLKADWGTASGLLHFYGAHPLTTEDSQWGSKKIEKLGSAIDRLREGSEKKTSLLFMKVTNMRIELRNAWDEFSSGKIKIDELRSQVKKLIPSVENRLPFIIEPDPTKRS